MKLELSLAFRALPVQALSFLALSFLYLCYVSTRNLVYPEVNDISWWLYLMLFPLLPFLSPQPVLWPKSITSHCQYYLSSIVRAAVRKENHKIVYREANTAEIHILLSLLGRRGYPIHLTCQKYALHTHMHDSNIVTLFLVLYYYFS